MKKWLMILTLMMFAMGAVGCGGKDKRTPVRKSDRDKRSDDKKDGSNRTVSAGKGTISTTQERIDLFVSVAGDPTKIIGLIDGSGAGVSFDGSAVVDRDGDIESASIVITIKDDFAVKGEKDPMQIETFDFIGHESAYRSTYGYDEVKLTFYDRDYEQALILEGTVQHSSGSEFKGTMYFENEGKGVLTDDEVVLGDFTIPACSFFKCNN